MINKEIMYVCMFYSTSLAIRGEKIARKENIKVKLIPTPRHLSSDCGIVLRFDKEDKDLIKNLFNKAKLDYDKICKL